MQLPACYLLLLIVLECVPAPTVGAIHPAVRRMPEVLLAGVGTQVSTFRGWNQAKKSGGMPTESNACAKAVTWDQGTDPVEVVTRALAVKGGHGSGAERFAIGPSALMREKRAHQRAHLERGATPSAMGWNTPLRALSLALAQPRTRSVWRSYSAPRRGGTSAARFQGKRAREEDLHSVIAVRVGGVQLHGVQDLKHPCTCPVEFLTHTRSPCA